MRPIGGKGGARRLFGRFGRAWNDRMNRHAFAGRDAEARLRYLDSDYQVVVPGSYVICAVTGQRIPLSELRYWSVDRQEPYLDAQASLKREQALRHR